MATENEVQDEEILGEQTEEGQTTQGEGEGSEEDPNEIVNTKEAQAEEDGAADDEEREAIRARRREERHNKKEAQREREATLRRELASRDEIINNLSGRLSAVEKRGQTTDLGELDRALKQSADGYNYFKEQHALAVQNQNGPMASDAMEKMIVSQRRYEDLSKIKQQAAQQVNRPAPLDPRVVNHAKNWLDKNKWYDPNGGNEDSQLASDIDTRLAASGLNPATPQYWEELESRLKKYLPHRFKTVHNGAKGGSPVAGSGRESAPSAGTGSFKLSQERVQALKDSGKWNDPAERERMIKYYKNYDKQRSAAGN